jgi:hypothetical protein
MKGAIRTGIGLVTLAGGVSAVVGVFYGLGRAALATGALVRSSPGANEFGDYVGFGAAAVFMLVSVVASLTLAVYVLGVFARMIGDAVVDAAAEKLPGPKNLPVNEDSGRVVSLRERA